MPDSMSSENRPITPDFHIGAPAKLPANETSMQAAQNEFKPEWKSSMSDIRMQLGNGGKDDGEGLNIMDLIRAMSGRAATSGLEKFSNGLQGIAETKERMGDIENGLGSNKYIGDEKDKKEEEQLMLKEKLENLHNSLKKKYSTMQEQSISVVNDLFVVSVDQKKNAYPYDHRTAELTIKTILETAQTLQEEEWADDPELSLWLKRMERDATWMAGLLQVSVGQSASAPYFFDVVMQMQVLKERYKAFITSEDLKNMHAKELPGLEFSSDEKAKMDEKGIGLKVDDEYRTLVENTPPEKRLLFNKEESVGLRELGVKMIDSSFAMRMRIAAVSQSDLAAPNGDKNTFMGDYLKPEEIAFFRDLLLRRNPKGEYYILSPHMASMDKDKRDATAYLEALLLTNAEERLNSIIANDSVNKENLISELVEDVKEKATYRITNWKSRDNGDIVSQLASLVTKQGLYEDYAFLNAYKYCWEYTWAIGSDGKFKKVGVETAGIYSYSGDIYSLYYMRRAAQYDRSSNSRTQLLLPTSKAGRKELDLMPYDKMPEYKPGMPGDQDRFLADQWDFVFGTDPKSKKARETMGYVDIPQQVADKLKSWAVSWKTPYNSKYVENDTSYELVVPHLMPPGLDIACFLDAIPSSETKLNAGGKSVWQSMVEGKRFSEVNWDIQENLPVDRWYVDLDMASRYMNVLIGVFDKEKDPIMGLINEGPSTLAPKEFAKRLRLSFRDSPKGYPEEYEVAFIPFIVTLSSIQKYDLTSASAWHDVDKSNMTSVEHFLLEISKWQRAFKWLPSDRPNPALLSRDSEGNVLEWDYGNTMALLMEFYTGVLLRVAKSSAEESARMASKNYQNTISRLNEMPFIGNGLLDRKPSKNLIP